MSPDSQRNIQHPRSAMLPRAPLESASDLRSKYVRRSESVPSGTIVEAYFKQLDAEQVLPADSGQ